MRIINWSLSEQSRFTDICDHEGLGKACAGCRDRIEIFLDAIEPMVLNLIVDAETRGRADGGADQYDNGYDAGYERGYDDGFEVGRYE